MATIIVGSYMVRYPLGGNLSWALQYLVGFKELGHDVYFVEKFVEDNSCYDPVQQVLSNDCTYGTKAVSDLLACYGLKDKWCFVEYGEIYHGLTEKAIKEVFKRADLYIENGAHGAWQEDSGSASLRIYIDVDPAFTQHKFFKDRAQGRAVPAFDGYYTNGMNVGKPGNIIPPAGINWGYIFNPVNTGLFHRIPPPKNAPYSTIMNWKSYKEIVEINGVSFGHKDIEFEKFKDLPQLVKAKLEIAVSGLREEKAEILKRYGWSINSAQKVTFSFHSFREYLTDCRGEFSVCKNMYTATSSGWFSDKSAAYMASGRPVVLQETGFSKYLPVGEGLFAVNDAMEAKNAIESIESNYDWHCKKAYEIAHEYLEAKTVLKKLLKELSL